MKNRMHISGKIGFGLILASLFALGYGRANAQGCVAIRHFSSCSGNSQSGAILHKGDLQTGLNYRYFRSFRHFKGSEEQADRLTDHTEVINYSHALDLSAGYGLTDRLYLSLTLPFVYNERSSLYEHGRTERHFSYSSGIADMRLGAGYWILPQESDAVHNVAFGLGFKLPTGNAAAEDFFHNVGADSTGEVRPVDQSIQPGDGGFGITLDFQGYQKIVENLFVYANGFYLINPRDTNTTRTYRETLSPLLVNEAYMSVPDQYSVRGGLNYALPKLGVGLSLGARYECVPVEDLIGESNGFRRPGSVLSIEPGASYAKGNLGVNFSLPVALSRNRPQSVTDLETEIATGQPRNGDAAFADYLINVGVTYRFSLAGEKEMEGVRTMEIE